MKGIVWGIVSYLFVWVALVVSVNLISGLTEEIGQLLVLCQVLAGVVAAKNSHKLPILNAVAAGTAIGLAIAGWLTFFVDEAISDAMYAIVSVALYFGIGGMLWVAAAFLTKQVRRRL